MALKPGFLRGRELGGKEPRRSRSVSAREDEREEPGREEAKEGERGDRLLVDGAALRFLASAAVAEGHHVSALLVALRAVHAGAVVARRGRFVSLVDAAVRALATVLGGVVRVAAAVLAAVRTAAGRFARLTNFDGLAAGWRRFVVDLVFSLGRNDGEREHHHSRQQDGKVSCHADREMASPIIDRAFWVGRIPTLHPTTARFPQVAQDLTLLRDLAVVLVTAAITALLFHKIRLPPVLGYLVAGVLVGPHILAFPLVREPANIEILANLGIIFLLFSLGLHFHLGRLRKVGGLAFTAGILEVSIMVASGFLLAELLGIARIDALFLGAILAISSTTLIVKVLGDLGRASAPSSEAIFGILLVEDLVAIVLIALLSSISLTGTVSVAAVAALVIRIAIFVVATLVIGLVLVPRLVDYVAKLRVEDLLVLLVVGIAFATAMVAYALDLSMALGAFIAGAVIAESRASATIERKVAPLRDVFTAVFFVSTGILINPADIATLWPVIIIFAIVTILGKIAAVSLATFVAGFPPNQALRVGIGMAMIGEFSFVIAGLGKDLGVTSASLVPIAVAVSAITAFVTPWLIRRSDTLVERAARIAPASWNSYARTYSAWVSRIRPREGEAFGGAYDYGAIFRALGFSAILAALAFGASTLNATYTRSFGSSVLAQVVYYAAFALAAVPIVIGLARAVRKLVDELVGVVVPPSAATSPRGAAGASVLRHTLYVFLSVIIALIAVAAGSPFLPPLPLLAAAFLFVAVAAFLLRGALKRLNTQVETAVDSVFRADSAASQRDEIVSLIRERYPWDVHVVNVIVPEGAHAANRRIRDLQLPQKSGATIVTHERDGVKTVNPSPDTLVSPGDTIGVIGEEQQVEHARTMLSREGPAAERPSAGSDRVQVEEIEVTETSPLSGITLAGSRIRETTGASVVGIRRDGVPILNPAPVMRLRPGDAIVVLGSAEQVRAVRRLVSGGT